MAAARSIPWFVEIGSNLADPMYKGMYHGKAKHAGMLMSVEKLALTRVSGHGPGAVPSAQRRRGSPDDHRREPLRAG